MNYNIYFDGMCKGNPGPGSYAFTIQNENGDIFKDGSGFENKTTNNRMELRGIIEALKYLEGFLTDRVVAYTDSAYVANAFSERWVDRWCENGWKTSEKKDVLNKDLWIDLIRLVRQKGVVFSNPKMISVDPEVWDEVAISIHKKAQAELKRNLK